MGKLYTHLDRATTRPARRKRVRDLCELWRRRVRVGTTVIGSRRWGGNNRGAGSRWAAAAAAATRRAAAAEREAGIRGRGYAVDG